MNATMLEVLWNIDYHIIINSIIFMFIGWITQNLHNISFRNIHRTHFTDFFKRNRGKTIKFENIITHSRHYISCQLTEETKGIFYYLHCNLDKLAHVKNVEAVDYATESTNLRKLFNVPIQRHWVDLKNGIQVRIKKKCEDVHSSEVQVTFSTTKVELEVYTSSLGYNQLEQFISTCIEKYNDYRNRTINGHMCYILRHFSDEDSKPIFDSYLFQTNKNVDNIFFEEKQDIISRIRFFESKEGEERYQRIGLPYTFGMFFCGETGSGKTSFIKAIAKLTKRHIIVIRMDILLKNHYENVIDVLKIIFYSPNIGDVEIAQRDRLYVFEEADTWQNLLCRSCNVNSLGSLTHSNQNSNTNNGFRKNKNSGSHKISSSQNEDNAQLDTNNSESNIQISHLGGLLELLDGVIETPGRMCIMTTNHPENIDPALVRRFSDVHHTFKRLSKNSVSAIYEQWFENPIPLNIEKDLKDCVFTQSQICTIFSSPNHSDVLKKLVQN